MKKSERVDQEEKAKLATPREMMEQILKTLYDNENKGPFVGMTSCIVIGCRDDSKNEKGVGITDFAMASVGMTPMGALSVMSVASDTLMRKIQGAGGGNENTR